MYLHDDSAGPDIWRSDGVAVMELVVNNMVRITDEEREHIDFGTSKIKESVGHLMDIAKLSPRSITEQNRQDLVDVVFDLQKVLFWTDPDIIKQGKD